jgi:hypothetical protein
MGQTYVMITEAEVETKAGEVMTSIKTKADEILGKISIKEEVAAAPQTTSVVSEVKAVAD